MFDNDISVIRDTSDPSFKTKIATKDKFYQTGFDKQTWNGWESLPEVGNSVPAYFGIATAPSNMWLERIHLSFYGNNADFSKSQKN